MNPLSLLSRTGGAWTRTIQVVNLYQWAFGLPINMINCDTPLNISFNSIGGTGQNSRNYTLIIVKFNSLLEYNFDSGDYAFVK